MTCVPFILPHRGGSDTMMDDSAEVDENFAYWAEWVDAV